MARNGKTSKAPKAIASQQSLGAYVKSICNIMRRSNCASALQYVPELTWIMFLRILDEQQRRDAEAADAVGETPMHSIVSPYRWQDWAAPYSDKPDHPKTPEGNPQGWKRQELFAKGEGAMFAFVNSELLPYLHKLGENYAGTPKQKVIARIMTAVERVRVDSETNLRDILDRVHQLHTDHVDDTHFFTLSQVYEDLLLKMGEKNSDGGQFFTPREAIRAMVRVLDPRPGEHIYDPCCGTGGFLAQTYEYLLNKLGKAPSATELDELKTQTFFGREKENLVFPIALANLILHGIDRPNLWHGNTLTGRPTYAGLFEKVPAQFEVVLTNPPFGGKEGTDAQKNFPFQTGSTQVLFAQHVLGALADGGRCGIVLDEGLLFRTNESAFVETKRKLTDECDLWCIVSLPGGVFSTAGAGVKTNLLFFTKGRRTEKIWYYDLSPIKVGKKTPLTLKQFEHFFELLPKCGTPAADSDHSWTVDFAARKANTREEAAPFRAEMEKQTAIAADARERLSRARRNTSMEGTARALLVDTLTAEAEVADRAARDARAKAEAIEGAVYDLKAVNPNVKTETDKRTPAEIILAIEQHGADLSAALDRLKQQLA